jgi:hypothetical protein
MNTRRRICLGGAVEAAEQRAGHGHRIVVGRFVKPRAYSEQIAATQAPHHPDREIGVGEPGGRAILIARNWRRHRVVVVNQLTIGANLEPWLGRSTKSPVASAVDIIVEDADHDHDGVQKRNETLGGQYHLVGPVAANATIDHRIAQHRLKLGGVALVLGNIGAGGKRIAHGQDGARRKRLDLGGVHPNAVVAGDIRGRIAAVRFVPPAQERIVFRRRLARHERCLVSKDIEGAERNSIPEPQSQLAEDKGDYGGNNGCDNKRDGLSRLRRSRLHCLNPGGLVSARIVLDREPWATGCGDAARS